jgi:hypothetical protein
MLPHQLERIAQDRMHAWEKEIRYQQLLTQIPREAPRWRRWMGDGMVWLGTWLMCWGERMVQRRCTQGVSVAG